MGINFLRCFSGDLTAIPRNFAHWFKEKFLTLVLLGYVSGRESDDPT